MTKGTFIKLWFIYIILVINKGDDLVNKCDKINTNVEEYNKSEILIIVIPIIFDKYIFALLLPLKNTYCKHFLHKNAFF